MIVLSEIYIDIINFVCQSDMHIMVRDFIMDIIQDCQEYF